MIYTSSPTAFLIFGFFVAVVLGISFFLGRKARSAKGYYAAHGQIHWFINGVAFAGDYLSAASFLGICGMIAFYGYDGFLYSIGYLAGWVVALFVIAEPLKRMGKFTFADALDKTFDSRGIKLAAAISTLVVSIFYLIPQMVGAGALVKPLLGFSHQTGVLTVGVVVILIVVTAGMVSTTYVQFIKGSLLVIFCAMLAVAILARGLTVVPPAGTATVEIAGSADEVVHRLFFTPSVPPMLESTDYGLVKAEKLPPGTEREAAIAEINSRLANEFPGQHYAVAHLTPMPLNQYWTGKPYVFFLDPRLGELHPQVWRKLSDGSLARAQVVRTTLDASGFKTTYIDGKPKGTGPGQADLRPVGTILQLPGGQPSTGSVGPFQFLAIFQKSRIALWKSDKIQEGPTVNSELFYPQPTSGADILRPGGSITFAGVRSPKWSDKLDFFSLMLALFCGTASLPHILIRYYTVKDQASARKSTVVGIASIGFFYVLTLYLGLGAMTSGALDPSNSNMAAPLLARSFGQIPFAFISAVAFTTVLGTVSGLIMAASGAVAHDLMENFLKVRMNDHQKVNAGKLAAVAVGVVAMALGIVFEKMNVSFLVGWAFNVAASANLPALVMLLFWKRTTRQGITAAIVVGMATSLAWVLLSKESFGSVYGYSQAEASAKALVPFSQPGIVTIPLGFLVLVVVSLMTPRPAPSSARD